MGASDKRLFSSDIVGEQKRVVVVDESVYRHVRYDFHVKRTWPKLVKFDCVIFGFDPPR